MSDGYYEAYINQDINHDRTKPVYYPGSRHYPIDVLDSPPRAIVEAPRHSSYHPPTVPMYQPSEIPTYHSSEVPIYQPSKEPQCYPTGYVPPNAHPSYNFLANRPIKEEPKSPPSNWLQCDSNPCIWLTRSPIPNEVNSQPTNDEGPSRRPNMRVRKPQEIFPTIPPINEDIQPMEEDPESEDEDPEEEDPEEKDTEEEDPEEEESEKEAAMGEEHPNDETSASIGRSLTSMQQSYGSVDPYVQYLGNLKNQASSSFPPFQGVIPSEKEQADEIREQNRVAQYLYLSSDKEYVPYPEPRNHYEMITLGYRDPPPQYVYPHMIPQSYEEHLDRALRESDDLRKTIDVESKKKKTMREKILHKCNKLTRVVKKFMKD